MRGGDDSHVALLAADAGAFERVVQLGRVGDADLDLSLVDHGDDHVVAGGRLHQYVESGFLLEHFGDGSGGGVVERPRLQRGEAVGLRRSHVRGQHACKRRATQAQQGAENAAEAVG